VVGEESGEYQLGTLGLVSRGYRTAGAIIAEPTGGLGPFTLAIASVGWLFLKIEIAGRATHVALRGRMRRLGPTGDAIGVNAVEKAHAIIAGLLRLEEQWDRRKRHELFEEKDFAIHPGVIHAGPSGIDNPAIVADHATLWYSVLYPPNETSRQIQAEIETYLDQICANDSWLREHPPQISWPLDWPPAVLLPEAPLVTSCRVGIDDLHAATGLPVTPNLAGAQGVTDASWLQIEGIPAVVCGPGEISRAHAVDESVTIDEIITAVKVYAAIALRWCGMEGRT
jgi:acetylornithine deacetylase